MSIARLIQLLGFLIVTVVMVWSYSYSNMSFQFGGLAVGAAVFLIGRGLEGRSKA
ncbi:MAG: hypothetical protein ACT4PU_10420 [Planctomycetota bacterium]